ncbi:helix-turn-helix domain-containing protein, partial [Streptomyces goshikiensis]
MRDDEAQGSPAATGPSGAAKGGSAAGVSALVRRAVEGDEQATHDLLAFVHPLAIRYCRTRLSRLPGDARHFVEDLAQEVCVAVLMALPRYRDVLGGAGAGRGDLGAALGGGAAAGRRGGGDL